VALSFSRRIRLDGVSSGLEVVTYSNSDFLLTGSSDNDSVSENNSSEGLLGCRFLVLGVRT
jgi:hypothetical protein